jgi:FtsH-binding integral membrane protein
MILPGLISAVFYRRRPSALQISLGLIFTVVLSALLGYVQEIGTSRVWENVVLAIVGGVILYVAILAYLVYWYFPRREKAAELQTASPTAPPH